LIIGADLRDLSALEEKGEVNHLWAFLAFIFLLLLVAY
jgi:hypothetical protein